MFSLFIQSTGQRVERGTKILEISEDRVLVAMDRKSYDSLVNVGDSSGGQRPKGSGRTMSLDRAASARIIHNAINTAEKNLHRNTKVQLQCSTGKTKDLVVDVKGFTFSQHEKRSFSTYIGTQKITQN